MGLVHGGAGRDLLLAAENLGVGEVLGPSVGVLGELQGGMGREVLRLRRAHLGRIDDGDDLSGLSPSGRGPRGPLGGSPRRAG